MGYAGVYRATLSRVLKITILLLIVIICALLYFVTKRIREPRVSIALLDSIKDIKTESVLFGTLDYSFVVREEWDGKYQVIDKAASASATLQDHGFISYSYRPHYEPLFDFESKLPLEASVCLGDETVPLREQGLDRSRVNACWDFVFDAKTKLYTIMPAEMAHSPTMYVGKIYGGFSCASNGVLYRTIELTEGYKEFVITDATRPSVTWPKDFDIACHVIVTLDGVPFSEYYVSKNIVRGEFDRHTIQYFTSRGWHTFGIGPTNMFYFKSKAQEYFRFYWVKKIDIYKLTGAFRLDTRRFERNGSSEPHISVSYFRASEYAARDDLLRFFKRRFHIECLRDVIMKGYSVWTLFQNTEIAGLVKPVIFAPAATKLRLRLAVPMGGIKLTFTYGIMQEAWDKPGDGVEFRVRLDTKENEPEVILFSRYINPKANKEDRKWFEGGVDLAHYGGKDITLVFETVGSAAKQINPVMDTAYDYAVWSS